MEKFIEQVFSKQSPLHSIIDTYEERSEQTQMAQAVLQALKQKEKLFVEAGTGVGKSLAYLLPIGLWVKEKKEKVLISTYTKILQNQLIKKDIPILKEILGLAQNDKEDEINCAVIFGQENYVCRRRMASVVNHGLFDTPYEFSELEQFQRWLDKNQTGIIPEYPLMLGRLAQKIGRDGDNCKYKKCPHYDNCYYFRARNEWFKADILIANHFLFFANVEAGYMILPKFDSVIFDEAHRLEEVASNFFGIEISNFGIHRLLNSIHNPTSDTGILAHIKINNAVQRGIDKMITEAHQIVDGMFTQFRNLIPIQANKIRIKRPPTIENSTDKIFASLITELLESKKDNDDDDLDLELKSLVKRLETYRQGIDEFLKADDKNSVYWIDTNIPTSKRSPIIYLQSVLIDIAQLFQTKVADKIPSLIFTSATLTVSKDFGFIKNRLGLKEAKTLLLHSPFDFGKQAVLYIPTDLPMPTDEKRFYQSVANTIDKILALSKGRALVLFTSFDSLQKTYDLVDKSMFEFLVQGQESVFELLERFKKDISSVLFATQSFWQGVDVPGEALSCLIIVRLPFDVPDDPRLEGICEQLRKNQQEPFSTYQLPNAVLRFRQGFGRLIRNKQDRGVVCVLDKRIVLRDYGKSFIYSLPKNLPMTFTIEAIRDFFQHE